MNKSNTNQHTIMRTIRLILLCLLASLSTQAQQDKKTADRLTDIREQYAKAMSWMAGEHVEDNMGYEMSIQNNRVIPALGSINETIHFYFGLDDKKFEEDLTVAYLPYFMDRRYYQGPREYFEEYLFDLKTGKLIFFSRINDNYDGGKDETRLYWGKNGKDVVHKESKGDEPADENEALTTADRLKKAFDLLVED